MKMVYHIVIGGRRIPLHSVVPAGLLIERSKCGLLGQCVLNGCPSCSSALSPHRRRPSRRSRLFRGGVGGSGSDRQAGLAEWDEFGTMSTEGQQVKSELELDLT